MTGGAGDESVGGASAEGAAAEGLGSIPRTRMAAHDCLKLQAQRMQHLLPYLLKYTDISWVGSHALLTSFRIHCVQIKGNNSVLKSRNVKDPRASEMPVLSQPHPSKFPLMLTVKRLLE